MSFQLNKSQLESSFYVLNRQASSTFKNWDDPIQKRFDEQFIESLSKEFLAYIKELNKLNKSFEAAEKNINDLQRV